MTTAELIAELKTLDAKGTLPVGIVSEDQKASDFAVFRERYADEDQAWILLRVE